MESRQPYRVLNPIADDLQSILVYMMATEDSPAQEQLGISEGSQNLHHQGNGSLSV